MRTDTLIKAIHEAFDPIAFAHGLRPTIVEPKYLAYPSVEYIGVRSFMRVGQEPRSPDITVVLGVLPNSSPANRMMLGDLMRAHGEIDAIKAYGIEARTPVAARAALRWLANATNRFATQLLDGEPAEVERIARYREWQVSNYELARHIGDARNSAENAWLRRDYARVRHSYESILPHLSRAEMFRLNYVRKQIGSDNA